METNPCVQIGGLALIPSQSSEILSALKNISISRLLTHRSDSAVRLPGCKVSHTAALQKQRKTTSSFEYSYNQVKLEIS